MPTGKPTEKPSNYPIGIEVFTGPHFNKYIPGYASGTYVYATVNAALEACENRYDCGGVTQESTDRYTLRNGIELIYHVSETSWLKRVFTGPHSNTYILGYASGTYEYATINLALEACKNRYDCGGVTQESTDRYTLRNGIELIYHVSETSWLKRVFTGPHSNTYILGYASGTYVYATINLALEACKNRCDCGGVTQESTNIYTLRKGGILIDWWETSWPSWLKISTTSC